MHRNRGYWERIIDADEVSGKHLKEKKGKQTLPVFEPKSLMNGFELVYSLTDQTDEVRPVATPVERLPYLGYPVMVPHNILEGQGPNEGQT